MGVQREGAFSEYVSMPLERIYDGKGLSARQLTLIEPFCIAHHGVKRGEVKSGDEVLIVGAGTIGVFAALSARAKGANVTLCDVSQEKLDYARNTFFFDSVILNNNSENFTDRVAEKTKGEGFDVAIEAVGLNSTFKNCIDAVCFGGRVVLIGIPKKPLDDFALNLIQKKELCVRGSRNALKEDFIELIDLVKSGAVDIEKVVTNEYSWLEADKAFSDFSANAGKMLKVLLRFD